MFDTMKTATTQADIPAWLRAMLADLFQPSKSPASFAALRNRIEAAQQIAHALARAQEEILLSIARARAVRSC
jgi:hypothetical protein